MNPIAPPRFARRGFCIPLAPLDKKPYNGMDSTPPFDAFRSKEA